MPIKGKQIKDSSIKFVKIDPSTNQILTLLGNTKIQQNQAPIVGIDLVNKDYVDNEILILTSSITNGLTYSNGYIKLGGDLIEDTYISGNTKMLQITGLATYNGFIIGLDGYNVGFELKEGNNQLYDWSSSGYISLMTNLGGLYLNGSDNGQASAELGTSLANTFQVFVSGTNSTDGSTNNRFLIRDEIGHKGIAYYGDYAANFTTHSLVTKGYVDSLANSSGSIGLSEVAFGDPFTGFITSSNIFKFYNNMLSIGTASALSALHIYSDNGGQSSGITLEVGSGGYNYSTIDFLNNSNLLGQFISTGDTFNNQAIDSNQSALLNYNDNGSVALFAGGLSGSVRLYTGGLDVSNISLYIDEYGQMSAIRTYGLTNNNGIYNFLGIDSDGKIFNTSLTPLSFSNSVINGLTQSGGVTKLGGDLIQYTTIDGQYDFSFGSLTALKSFSSYAGDYTKGYTSLYNNDIKFEFITNDNRNLVYNKITGFQDTGITIETRDKSGFLGTIYLSTNGYTVNNNGTNNTFTIYDQISSKGMVYYDDYSPNFTPESLITKRYVDNKINNSSLYHTLTSSYIINTNVMYPIYGDLTLNAGQSLDNDGRIVIINGQFINNGTYSQGLNGSLEIVDIDLYGIVYDVDSTRNIKPKAMYTVWGDFTLDAGQTLTNDGRLVIVNGQFINNGTYSQGVNGSIDLVSTDLSYALSYGNKTYAHDILWSNNLGGWTTSESTTYFATASGNVYVTKEWVDSEISNAKSVSIFTPGPVNTANTISHGLGTSSIVVQLWDITSGDVITADSITNATTTTVDVYFSDNPPGDVKIIIV